MEALRANLSLTLFTAAIRSATPILYAALGGIFSERSGVLNIALEGIMLISAFTAVVGSYYTGNPWIGVLFGVVGGTLASLIHAFMSIHLQADQAIVGTGINILGIGLPNFLMLKIWGQQGLSPIVERIDDWTIPFVADLPIIGPVLGKHSPLVYLVLVLVPVCYYLIFKTRFGLRLRSVGENPRAADTVGINVYRMRYYGVLLSGVMASLGGGLPFRLLPGPVCHGDDRRPRLYRPGGHDLRALEPVRRPLRLPAFRLCRRAAVRRSGWGSPHPPPIFAGTAVRPDDCSPGGRHGPGLPAGIRRQTLPENLRPAPWPAS